MPYRWISGERYGTWKPTKREAEKAAVQSGVARVEAGAVTFVDGGSVEHGDGKRRADVKRRKTSAVQVEQER